MKQQSNKKKLLGQFYTTNSAYICQNLNIPFGVQVIEPFAGRGDLLHLLMETPSSPELYDIDPKCENCIKRDTLLDVPDYNEKFVLTNPPFVARNKCDTKIIFDKYGFNDLYKCFLYQLTQQNPIGGIIIVPLNFLSSIRKMDVFLRKLFMDKFQITIVNIFENCVFEDTASSVCSFQFIRSCPAIPATTSLYFYPSGFYTTYNFRCNPVYCVGGEIYNLSNSSTYKIDRWTSDNVVNTNILVKCIDDDNPISLAIVNSEELHCDTTPQKSTRSYMSLVITPFIPLNMQKMVVQKFNEYLTTMRTKYRSLFLTSYRENTRKRISFDLVYRIVLHILDTEYKSHD